MLTHPDTTLLNDSASILQESRKGYVHDTNACYTPMTNHIMAIAYETPSLRMLLTTPVHAMLAGDQAVVGKSTAVQSLCCSSAGNSQK